MIAKDKINNGRSRKGVNRYIDEEFAKILDEIKKSRIASGIDEPNNMKADWRITLAIARHPNLKEKIMKDVINATLE
ncbi:hypothetical protein LCGC14_0868760 [marine sediment metagenome]|uniref:Uncharacterized protein n=1 Tax=marine sediment metagenome TaxID=412755 RepID=A0A0F9P5B4_9ZZZZ